MITPYKVIWADCVHDLEVEVNRHLAQGIWELQGGVTITQRQDTQMCYCQAMVLQVY